METDWDKEFSEPFNLFKHPIGGEELGRETLDPGFHQPSYTNEELSDVVDLSNLSDQFDDSAHEISNPVIRGKPG